MYAPFLYAFPYYVVVVLKSLRRGMELRFSVRSLGCALFYFGVCHMIITFCGHSDYIQTANDEKKILTFLEQNINEECVDFYLGGYGKFDSFAYTCAQKYQTIHPSSKLIYVTPYLNPKTLTQNYDLIIYPELESVPPKFAISYRNKWMIEKSDIVIAYVNRSFGGAYKSYNLAKKSNKTILNIAKSKI